MGLGKQNQMVPVTESPWISPPNGTTTEAWKEVQAALMVAGRHWLWPQGALAHLYARIQHLPKCLKTNRFRSPSQSQTSCWSSWMAHTRV
jgi:hypothetical protein